jgi:hypothetical protein
MIFKDCNQKNTLLVNFYLILSYFKIFQFLFFIFYKNSNFLTCWEDFCENERGKSEIFPRPTGRGKISDFPSSFSQKFEPAGQTIFF